MGSVADLPASDPRRPEGFFEPSAGGLDSSRMQCGEAAPLDPWQRLRAAAQVVLRPGQEDLMDMIFGDEEKDLQRKLLRKDWAEHRGSWRNGHIDRPRMSPEQRTAYEREPQQRRSKKIPAQINWEMVRQIREDRVELGYTYRQLSHKYGISIHQVTDIVTHRTWREDDDAA